MWGFCSGQQQLQSLSLAAKLLHISPVGNISFFPFLACLPTAAPAWNSHLSVVPFLAAESLRFQAEDGKLWWFGVFGCENQGIFTLSRSIPALLSRVYVGIKPPNTRITPFFFTFIFLFLAVPAAHQILQDKS